VKMNHMTQHDHKQMTEPHGSHDRHAGHSVAMFRDKFWLTLALTVPVVFWSADVQNWLGYTAPTFPGSKFIPPILGTVAFLYGGLVFIRGAQGELADHKPGMMTLISLGITAAFGTSLAGTFGLFGLDVWWELSSCLSQTVGRADSGPTADEPFSHYKVQNPAPKRASDGDDRVTRENEERKARQAHGGRSESQRITAHHPRTVLVEAPLTRAGEGQGGCQQPH
jgi:hypothetical protein